MTLTFLTRYSTKSSLFFLVNILSFFLNPDYHCGISQMATLNGEDLLLLDCPHCLVPGPLTSSSASMLKPVRQVHESNTEQLSLLTILFHSHQHTHANDSNKDRS